MRIRKILFYSLIIGLASLPLQVFAQGYLPPPRVETSEASHISATTAKLNGKISGRAPSPWFEYGTSSGSYTDSSVGIIGDTGRDDKGLYYLVSYDLTSLLPETTYYFRIAGNDSYLGYTTDTSYGEEKSFTTLAATVTPTLTTTLLLSTPSPSSTPAECLVQSLEVSKKRLVMKRGQSKEVVVTVAGEDCIPVGIEVTANISRAGFGRMSLSSTSEITDVNGQATFIIKGRKPGRGKITFKVNDLEKTVIVKII